MRHFAGLGPWPGYFLLLLTVGTSACAVVACSSSGSVGGGAGSGEPSAGSGGTAFTGGVAGAGAYSGSHSSGAAGSAGSPIGGGGGAGGMGSAGTEIAVSFTACQPACPDQQYCALLGPECMTEPCLVHALCRDRPACGASLACPVASQNTCLDDPSDSCNPAATGMTCPGRCYCTEGPHPCGPQALDPRPTVCTCVTPGPAIGCLNVKCPGDDVCDIVLGKEYCIIP
jgi:hypothetical protein